MLENKRLEGGGGGRGKGQLPSFPLSHEGGDVVASGNSQY